MAAEIVVSCEGSWHSGNTRSTACIENLERSGGIGSPSETVCRTLQTMISRLCHSRGFLVLAVLLLFVCHSGTRLRRGTNERNRLGSNNSLSRIAGSDDPYVLLAEADRLYWLNNGFRAAPLYAKAERLLADKGDIRNEIHAKVGRLRTEAETMSFVELSGLLNEQLRNPVVQDDSRLRLWCLIAKGYTDIEVDYRAAKQDWREAQSLARKVGENRWATRASGELGLIAFLEGHFARAARLVGGALIVTMASGDAGGQIRFLELIGNGFEEVNRHVEALKFFERAITVADAERDSGFPFMAYEGKAQALIALGKSDEAGPILEKAMAQARSQKRRGHEAQLSILLGKLSAQTGDRKQAIAYLKEAGQFATRVQFFRMEADTLFELAKLYGDNGDVATAATDAVQGLSASRRVGDHYYLPRNLTILAQLEARRGKVAQADALYKQAEDAIEGMLMSVDQPYWNSSIAGSMGQAYLQHFELLCRRGNITEAFRVLERIRGRTLARSLQDSSAFRAAESKQTVELEKNVAGVQARLMRATSTREREQLLDKLVEYERRLGWAWLKPEVPRRKLQVVPLRRIQEDLRRDELILEYVLDDPSSFCLSISRRGAHVRALPAGRREIEGLAREFIDEIHSKGTGARISKQLYELLVKPIPETGSATRFIIAPDGILNLFPFEALRDAQGGYLLESRIISYVPSGTILDTLRHTVRRQLAPKNLLAVGDVAYDDQFRTAQTLQLSETNLGRIERSVADLSGIVLHNLPQTRREVKEISKIFGPDAVVLLGKDATETTFKKEPLNQFRVLHLAVHGFADMLYPERSAIVLGVDPTSGDDGLLQAREIMRLGLNAELTTLSACDSGMGRLQGQEGISNLVEAFLVAGSKSVVASLWSADDTFASALMEEFYGRLSYGEDVGQALRNAKLGLLARYGEQASPFYWAGFVIVGEAVTPVLVNREPKIRENVVLNKEK